MIGIPAFPAIIHLTQQQDPIGTDGLEFIELAAPDPVPLAGFAPPVLRTGGQPTFVQRIEV
ncbi:MAG TPA: hypothetical protein VN326_17150 [Casimicrobiaceae bacterium]|nr:hypothetical protein [Casimicrobiaceae bacterium]